MALGCCHQPGCSPTGIPGALGTLCAPQPPCHGSLRASPKPRQVSLSCSRSRCSLRGSLLSTEHTIPRGCFWLLWPPLTPHPPLHLLKGTATSPSKNRGATPDLAQEHSPGCPCIPWGAASRSVGGKEDISPCPVEKHSWQFKTNNN